MPLPDPVISYFRSAPLAVARDQLRVRQLLVAGRGASGDPGNYPNTLQEAMVAILEEAGQPMRRQALLDEFRERYPGRSSLNSLRTSLTTHARNKNSRIMFRDGVFSLREWPDAKTRPPRPKPEPVGRRLGSGIKPGK